MSSLIENNYPAYHQENVTVYHQTTEPLKITALENLRTKLELLEQLNVVEIGLKKSLKLRPTKSTTKKLGLLEELKRRVEASKDDILIPFNLQSPPHIRTSCRAIFCMKQRPDQVVLLDRQLTEALASLSAQEDDFVSENTSSGSTIDTTSSECSLAEMKSILPHDSVTVISENSVQLKESEPINILLSNEESSLQPDSEEAATVMTLSVSTQKTGEIPMKHTDDGFVSENTSSGSTIDTTTSSESSVTETKSFSSHDSVTISSENNVQLQENEPINILVSGEESSSQPDLEEAPTVMAISVSTHKTRGILMKHTDYGNDVRDGCCTSDDATRKHRSRRNTKTVRFCHLSSVRLIKPEPTLEDKLAQARRLISEARNSQANLTGC